mgnify:CR=1 FL=1
MRGLTTFYACDGFKRLRLTAARKMTINKGRVIYLCHCDLLCQFERR